MLTLIGKQDRTALIPYDSIEIPQVVGDPLSKAHFDLKDQSASIKLNILDEVIVIDETVALTPSLVVPSPFADSFATNDLSANYTSTYASGGSAATWTYNGGTATITFDAAAGNKVASGTTNTYSHTVANQSNRTLIVAVSAGVAPSGVTYAGVPMTQLGTGLSYNGGAERMSLWYLTAPATNANNVVITCGSSTYIVGASVSYYNVAQTSVFGTLATNTGSGTSSTNTVTTTSSNQLVIDMVDNANAVTDTAGSSQTKRIQTTSSGVSLGDKAATGSNMTLTWTFTSTPWGQMSVALNPATTTPTVSASGGSHALLLVNSWTATNGTYSTTLSQADAGGLCFNVVDASDYYEVVIGDASSPNANTVTLYEINGGTRTQRGTHSISFTRGTSHTLLATVENGVITVYFDGTSIITYTDATPLGAGQAGLRNDTVSGASSGIYTALSLISNDIPTLLTSQPCHNYLQNNNFTYGNSGWIEAGSLSGRVTFPSSGTFGSGAVATLTFSNQAVGTDSWYQTTSNNRSSSYNYAVAGQQYCLSATVNVTTAFTNASVFLQLVFLDVTGATLGTFTSVSVSAAGSSRLSVTGTAPANSYSLRALFGGTTTSTTNSGTATFTAFQLEPMWFPSRYSYPSPICDFLQGDSVTLPDGTATRFDRIFTGFITNLKVSYDGATRISAVEATSADWLMENATLVNNSYNGATDQSIITGIVNNIFPRIIYAATPSLASTTPLALAYRNVPFCYAGVSVSGLEFADDTIREVLNALSGLSGFLFGVDAYYNLYYYPPYFNAALYAFSSSPDNVSTFPFYDFEVEYDGTQLQNIFYVSGNTYATTITENFTAVDGTHNQYIVGGKCAGFYLTYPTSGTQEIPTVVFGGVNQTCALDTGVGFGTSQTMLQWSNQHIGIGTAIAAGTSISVTYTYDSLAYVRTSASDSVAQYGRDIYGKVNDTALLSNAAATSAGEANLQTYAFPRVTVRFKCQYLVSVGQVITLTDVPTGISAQHFTVNKVTARHKSAGITEYEVEAGTYLDDFVDFFRNTQKALTRASHSPTAPIQQYNVLLQDSLSYSDSLNIHP